MNDIVIIAKTELDNLKITPTGDHIATGEVRKLSAKLFKEMKDKSIDCVFTICEELLEQREWAMGVIAYDFAYRMKSQYNEKTFFII